MQVVFTYVLVSESTGKTYVGQTEDLRRRIEEHNDPNNRRTLHTKETAWAVDRCSLGVARIAGRRNEERTLL